MKLSNTIFAVMMLFLTVPSGQAQMEPMKPAPELKKLDYFVGTWKIEGEMKKGPMGPGGKMTETERNEWMEGGFFLVEHNDFRSDMGKGVGTAYLGYEPLARLYTYDAFNSMGEAEHAHGTLKNDTWVWDSEMMVGSKHMHTRFTIKVLSPTTYDFKFEMSYDEVNWLLLMDGKATKEK